MNKEEMDIPSLDDLKKERERIEEKRNAIYKKILYQVVKEIKEKNRAEKFHCRCTIPYTSIEDPAYNFVTCVWYVVSALRKKGFLVRYFQPNVLYINWQDRKN